MAFDPYHKWLGIPPEEQPPNHYRLLSVPQFESDADVIETAAEQRTLLLRTFQIGPEAGLAERLLNEVAVARVCLLNPDSKAEYDALLRDVVTEAEPPPAIAEVPAPPAVFPAEYEQLSRGVSQDTTELHTSHDDSKTLGSILAEEYPADPLESPRTLAQPRSQERTRLDSFLIPVVVGGLVLISVIGALWWFVGRGGSDDVVAKKTPPTQQTPEATAAENAAAAKAAADKLAADKLAAERAAAEKRAAEKVAAVQIAAEAASRNLAAEKAEAEKAAMAKATAQKALKERSHAPEPKKEPSKSDESLDNYVALYSLIIPRLAGDNYSRIVSELELQKYKANYTGPRTEIYTEKLGYASLKQQAGLVPLYQYRTRTQKRLLYQTYREIRNSHEQERLLGWVGLRDLNNPSGMVPIYTLKNFRTDKRRFTSDPVVLKDRLNKGDKMVRILAYVFEKNLPGSSDPPKN